MRSQRGEKLGEAPAFDDRELVQEHLARNELREKLDRRGTAIDAVLAGLDAPGIIR